MVITEFYYGDFKIADSSTDTSSPYSLPVVPFIIEAVNSQSILPNCLSRSCNDLSLQNSRQMAADHTQAGDSPHHFERKICKN